MRPIRIPAALAMVAVLVGVSCEGGRSPGPHHSSPPPSSTVSRPPERTGPSAQHLPTIVLGADLSTAAVRWKKVASIPFGESERNLGYVPEHHGALGVFPPSFAVDRKGSLWILDLAKDRIAHYSGTGTYLGAVNGIIYRLHEPLPEDVVLAGKGLLLLRRTGEFIWKSTLARVLRRNGTTRPHLVTVRGEPVAVLTLVPGRASLVGQVLGWSGAGRRALGTGPSGYAHLYPGGEARIEPGVPLGDGRWMGLSAGGPWAGGEQDIRVEYIGPQARAVRQIHVRIVAGKGGQAHRIPGGLSIGSEVALEHGVAMYVRLGPTRAEDARYGDGRWLLEVFDDATPLVWEKLPEPGVSDETSRRRLTVGPDGALYLMVPTPAGMDIYRR